MKSALAFNPNQDFGVPSRNDLNRIAGVQIIASNAQSVRAGRPKGGKDHRCRRQNHQVGQPERQRVARGQRWAAHEVIDGSDHNEHRKSAHQNVVFR